MSQLLSRVIFTDHAILKSNPPQLFIYAVGETPTLGWAGGELSRRIYVNPPADGILEYELSGTPPAGLQIPAIGILSAKHLGLMDHWVKGYRIYTAQSDPYVVLLDTKRSAGDKNLLKPGVQIEAGTGINGFAGITRSGKHVSGTKLSYSRMDFPGVIIYSAIRELSNDEVMEIFNPGIIQELRSTSSSVTAPGIFSYIIIREADHFHEIRWNAKGQVPVAIEAYHSKLYNLM